jgi:hypothetical protein
VYTGVWWENLRERDYLEDVGIDGRKILKRTSNTLDQNMQWIGLAQYRARGWALVNVVMDILVP